MRLDCRDRLPAGLEEYLAQYGWHFSKKLCEWACSRMTKSGNKILCMSKDELEALLKKYGINILNNKGYDAVYVANMCKSDYYGTSVTSEAQLARFVKDYLDDSDGYEEIAMTRFYADMIGTGTPIIWEDMI